MGEEIAATAQTAMWIAECKMMEQTNRILSKNFTPLPLADSAHIVEGNALRIDWTEQFSVLIKSECSFIMGNPPFVGARMMAQGSQVPILWSVLLNDHHVTIDYAHRTFKWDSEATDKAAVFCVIVSMMSTT